MPIPCWLLFWIAFGALRLEAAPHPCPALPPLLAERLAYLDAAYPEWELPTGTYCMAWSGNNAFWTFTDGADTLYAPPIVWQGELSPGLARTLHALAEKWRSTHTRRSRPLFRSLASLTTAGLVTLFILHGTEHYQHIQELHP